MKEKAGLSSRCMPFEQEHLADVPLLRQARQGYGGVGQSLLSPCPACRFGHFGTQKIKGVLPG